MPLIADIFLKSFSTLLANPWAITFLIAIIFFIVLAAMVNLIRKSFAKGSRLPTALQQQILLISVPKESLRDKERAATPQDIQDDIGAAENLFSVLGSLSAQRGARPWLYGRTDHFSFEMVAQNGQIFFYVAAPNYLSDSLKQQLLAVYPHAHIEEVSDYNFFSPQGAVLGAYLKLGREFIFPIKTFKKMEGSDPLEGLVNPLSKVAKTDGAAIQFIVRSAYKKWHRKGMRVAREMQQGKAMAMALRQAGLGNIFDKFFGLFSFIFSFFRTKPQDERNLDKLEEQYRLSPMEEEAVKGIEEKTSRAGFDVNVRIVTSAVKREQAKNYLDNIINAFGQYNIYQYGNGFKKIAKVNIDRLVSDFISRSYHSKYHLLLNSEEMTSLWHLPLPSTGAPNIHWLEARKAQPPVNLPQEGILLGENIYRGVTTPIRIKEEDRQRHVYIIGKSGTGKSVLQANMIIQDMQNGEGVCVIDPHGDLVEAVLEHVPPERAEDVILFDPADYQRPMGINMLEFHNPEQKTFVINEMIKIFDKLYDLKATGGPMFEQYMRNAMLLMMEDSQSGSTLLEIPKVLADANFRRYKLSRCVNPVVKDFWEKEAEKAGGEASLANMVPYITSKLTPFISSDLMRPIIAQQKSSFNFREAMDGQKIILVKLSKGAIGEMSCNLLGMVIVGKILMAALSRVDIPQERRRSFYLYIDEFQNFITDTISVILSEARKYKLCLTIAHQYIGQLVKNNDTSIRDAVMGNAGTMIAFRIGPDDAEIVAKQLAPVFNEYDVINIPKYNAYLKLLIDNQNPPAFNIKPLPPQLGDKAIAAKIRELSRLKYGRDREIVEREILERVKAVQKPEV
ncbi:type IV secretion system DNA-binding domain-containing protein [Patescibacteria group bacterium]|nr:type IV secretion system DNA-binding domain-containing protein [Patescibacteria group bacterium]